LFLSDCEKQIRAGGWEVVTATWVPWLLPDLIEEDVAAALFRYDSDGKQDTEQSWIAKFKKAIGL
jgi:hypothetical protein